mgnify:CR=1 FL=1|tara:strand:- start:753 stop:1184 length:432 start_codon:yes stop_codon:yes gene_type:complete
MNHRFQTFLRFLLILIVSIGPLQAQTVFACLMMDKVMDECCCDGHQTGKECLDSDCEVAVGAREDPCCEQSAELQIDEDARQDTRVTNLSEVRSDVDPPQAIVTSFDAIVAPQGPAVIIVLQSQPFAHHSGSDTYLITQRLRI